MGQQKANQKIHYVYAHYTLDTNELFYIGMGSGDRHSWSYCRNSFWTNIVKKHGFKYVFLHTNLTRSDANDLEIQEIQRYRPKANFTKGGDGGDTYSTLSPDKYIKVMERKRQSMLGKGKGVSKTLEHRKKLVCQWRCKPVLCLDTGEIFESVRECARRLNSNQANVGKAIKNRWKCKGYRLEFINENAN